MVREVKPWKLRKEWEWATVKEQQEDHHNFTSGFSGSGEERVKKGQYKSHCNELRSKPEVKL